ncbi:MAG: Gfo/Idh/MocA family protein [Armatimonadota bacterium]
MSDAVRLALVGCGGIAGSHLSGYEALARAGYDRFAITAVCDVSEHNAAQFADRIEASFGARPAIFRTADEMAAAGAADAADIALPHAYHHSAGLACLRAGIHVLIEKPVGITVQATRRLMEAAEGTNLIVAGAEQVRRYIGPRAIHWAINERGMLGHPRFFTQEVLSASPFDRTSYKMAWRSLKLLGGGGQIIDSGAHFADMVQHVYGPVATVMCTMCTVDDTIINLPDIPPQPVDVEDYWTATLIFESGLIGHWSWSNYALGGEKVSTRRHYGSAGCFADRQEWQHPFQYGADLCLPDGTTIAYEQIEAEYLASLSEEQQHRLFPYGIRDAFAIECWDFVEAVAEGRAPEIDAAEALRAKSVCFALYESAHAGEPVKVADVLAGRISAYQDPINEYWGI